MNIFRKAFIAIVLLTASLSALAFDLPVHHQYVLFNSEARNTDYYNYDMHVVWHKEPDASQMGYYAQFAFYFQTGSVGYMGLQKDNQSGKKDIFSIWVSQGLAQPASSACKRFDTAQIMYNTGVGNPCQHNNSANSNGFNSVTSVTPQGRYSKAIQPEGIPTWAVWRLGFTNPTAVASFVQPIRSMSYDKNLPFQRKHNADAPYL